MHERRRVRSAALLLLTRISAYGGTVSSSQFSFVLGQVASSLDVLRGQQRRSQPRGLLQPPSGFAVASRRGIDDAGVQEEPGVLRALREGARHDFASLVDSTAGR